MSARGRGCLTVAVWLAFFWLLVAGLFLSSYPVLVVSAAGLSLTTLALGIELARQA